MKLWKETNEYVCLSCRLSLLAQEFEGTETREDVEQVKYYAQLMEVKIE
ncbi:MAG TPA: hypothetical protein VES68_01835 [Candidatus Sulfotelmatobacter sp.]|nr:hypothetical protein [Candidatus Sulfotelmatobacter sp.]